MDTQLQTVTPPQTALALAEEVKQIAQAAHNAQLLEREQHARRMDTLLDELARAPSSREAVEVLRFVLEVDGFGDLRVPGRMPCRAIAIDVLAQWGFLELVSEADQQYWRKQTARWSKRQAPEPSTPSERPRTASRVLWTSALLLFANLPAGLLAAFMWSVMHGHGRNGLQAAVLAVSLAQIAITFAGSLRAFLDGGDAARALGRKILWTTAGLYGLGGLIFFLFWPPGFLILALPGAAFAGATQLL